MPEKANCTISCSSKRSVERKSDCTAKEQSISVSVKLKHVLMASLNTIKRINSWFLRFVNLSVLEKKAWNSVQIRIWNFVLSSRSIHQIAENLVDEKKQDDDCKHISVFRHNRERECHSLRKKSIHKQD